MKVVYKYQRNYELNRKNWTDYEAANFLYSERILMGKLEFDSLGMNCNTLLRYRDTIGLKMNDLFNMSSYTYIYDKEDFEKKSLLSFEHNFRYPVISPYKVFVNHLNIYERSHDTTPKIYEYILDDKKRIVREDYYLHNTIVTDSMRDNNATFEQRIFSYDDKGRIIQVKFLPDEYLNGLDAFMYGMADRMVEDVYLSAGAENLFNYKYDDKDRITQVIISENGSRLLQENYTYYEDSKSVKKLDRFTLSSNLIYITKNMDLFYDRWGNLTQRIDINDAREPIRWRYYEYEYDEQNNWIRCDMFMEGNKEKTAKPTLSVFREIEYYE